MIPSEQPMPWHASYRKLLSTRQIWVGCGAKKIHVAVCCHSTVCGVLTFPTCTYSLRGEDEIWLFHQKPASVWQSHHMFSCCPPLWLPSGSYFVGVVSGHCRDDNKRTDILESISGSAFKLQGDWKVTPYFIYDWLARSSDLITCNIFLPVKRADLLYQTKTLEELHGRIQEVMPSITQEFLINSFARLEKLVWKYLDHIEF